MSYEAASSRRDRIIAALELAKKDHKAYAGTLTDWNFIQSLDDAIEDVRDAYQTRMDNPYPL